MQSAYTAVLLASIPKQELLFVVVMFTLAALALFALAVEAGNYPKFTAGIGRIRESLRPVWNRRSNGEGFPA
jgi:hypothetical protein